MTDLAPPFNLAAGEINRANAAIKRVRPVCGTGVPKIGIENVFAMWPSWTPIVDDERENDRARSRFPVRNVFTPESGPNSVTAKAIEGTTLVAAAVSCASASLIGGMIRRGETHPGRQRERLFWASRAQEAHCLVYRAQSLFYPPLHSSRNNDEAGVVARPQLSNIRRVKSWILSRNVDLPSNGAA